MVKKSEASIPRRRPKKIVIPRRMPSVVIPEKRPNFITPDKTTCLECICYPKEDPYVRNKKLNPCQRSPLTLYKLAAEVVDLLSFPAALSWSVQDVSKWMEDIGFPQFKDCILKNQIDGMRLLMLEDPSKLADLNIKDFDNIKRITSKIRELYCVELVRFARSISLPQRKPLTHCTWFKSRTGPTWGVRRNKTRCDILRWMKIIMQEPIKMDHWDLVWYQKPDFPNIKFARIGKRPLYQTVHIPHYEEKPEENMEFLVPRRFKLQENIPESEQYIWMENIASPKEEERKKKVKKMVRQPKESRLVPKNINLTGLKGKEFLLAKRKTPKPKFLP